MFFNKNYIFKSTIYTFILSLACTITLAQDYTNKSGKIMAYRPLTLLEGTNALDLERFGREQLTPIFKNQVPGVKSYIIKGERGDNKDNYVHLLIFDNKATRDFYFPWEHSGESNIPEVALKLWRPGQIMLLDSLPKYVKPLQEITNYTDYIFVE